ncbi:hypothetical protein THAOC_28085 [Thalassiosira oceanica]|uniref:Uncharacterized protein n=1 Tax=Thalassiosira oceanica TaxID=159749 RepID=K0RFY0_THAOC|nr:hypothetical protein THAOC_28085 [Thalassiosira oceanica]|eukprot:EJK52623.1 hypothetical protein THAOC_28085 [Thalassiosira oceanica]
MSSTLPIIVVPAERWLNPKGCCCSQSRKLSRQVSQGRSRKNPESASRPLFQDIFSDSPLGDDPSCQSLSAKSASFGPFLYLALLLTIVLSFDLMIEFLRGTQNVEMGGRGAGPAQNYRTSTRQISTNESTLLLGEELELDLILKFYWHVGNICSSPVERPVEIRPLESSAVQPRGSMAVRLRSTNSSRSGKGPTTKRTPKTLPSVIKYTTGEFIHAPVEVEFLNRPKFPHIGKVQAKMFKSRLCGTLNLT